MPAPSSMSSASASAPFAFGLSGPACNPPPAKKANTKPGTPIIVDLLDFDPCIIDADLGDGVDVVVDGYTPGTSRSRTPPREHPFVPEPVTLPPSPVRIPDDQVQLCDVYGLLFSQASNHTTLLKHIDKVSADVSVLSECVDGLKSATSEAQSAASIAISSVQALSVTVDQKFAVLEQKFSGMSLAPPAPTPSSPPRTTPSAAAGINHIEAVILGWPSFTRTSVATPWLIALLNKVNTSDSSLSPIFKPIGGNFCKLGVFRFETYEDRRDFIAIVRSSEDHLDFNSKGSVSKLYIKASVPKDVAKDTDILRSAVFKCHDLLKPTSVDSKDQLLTCYKTRTLTLFDIPIAFYIDSQNTRLETREGGEFCIDRKTILGLSNEKGFAFNCDDLVQFLSKKFVGRNIVDK